jgi:plasmid maintenance system antidote protein VapI
MKTYTEAQVVEMLRSRITYAVTQVDLARELGINRPTLSEILNGKRRPTKQVAASLGFVRVENLYRRNAKRTKSA